MRILVTGGAGYKGTVLTKRLLDQGHQVAIMDNFMYGYEPVLHLVEYPALDIIKEDVRNLKGAQIKDFDVIYHLAGVSGYPACEANPHSAKLINVDACRMLRDTLSRDQLLIYASTTSFYGGSGAVCTEETAPDPVSVYGVTKFQGEQVLMEHEKSVALRFATLFGPSPKMRVDLLTNDFVYKAVTERCLVLFDSQTKRTFLHLQDAIRAYLFVLDHVDNMVGQIFNVGDNEMNYSKMELAENVTKHTNCEIIDSDMQDFDKRHFIISFDKIRALGFRADRSLDAGIQELVRLYSFYRPFSVFRTI